jgi:hypothetical protein
MIDELQKLIMKLLVNWHIMGVTLKPGMIW